MSERHGTNVAIFRGEKPSYTRSRAYSSTYSLGYFDLVCPICGAHFETIGKDARLRTLDALAEHISEFHPRNFGKEKGRDLL